MASQAQYVRATGTTTLWLGPIQVHSVLIGRAVPFGRPGVSSAISKRPVEGPLVLGTIGLAGDEHGESVNHGGSEKAVLHYAMDHYQEWKSEHRGWEELLAQPGAFGENIATMGMTEADVCVGDTYRLGAALVQVSQPRRPCWRLNIRFGYERMASEVQRTGRCGWYYRVIETGSVGAGDSISLTERPNPTWSLRRLLQGLSAHCADASELSTIASLPLLADSMKTVARARLEQMIS